jgi:hypothetical protein
VTKKHTPGPWAYQSTAGNHDFAVYEESTGRDVALVRDFSEANARLITAAPNLLDWVSSRVIVCCGLLGGTACGACEEARFILANIEVGP